MSTHAVRIVRVVLLGAAAIVVVYLAVIAGYPSVRTEWLGPPLDGFGNPGSFQTVAVAVVLILAACGLTYYSRHRRGTATVPIGIVLGLVLATFALGFSAYSRCGANDRSTFFTPLIWTAALLKGGVDDRELAAAACPDPVPVALEVARITALAAIFIGVVSVIVTLFHAQAYRLRLFFTRRVTLIVGIDDDARPLVAAIATTSGRSRLVVVTGNPDRPCVHEARRLGASIVTADMDALDRLGPRRLWRKLSRLYLLSPHAARNVDRLKAITRAVEEDGTRRRIPLTVRIDDPWLARAWCSEDVGRPDARWAVDTVGVYAATARRLVEQIRAGRVNTIVIAGSSYLTLAMCAEIAQQAAEQNFLPADRRIDLPGVVLVADDADEFGDDHRLYQRRRRRESQLNPRTVPATPSVRSLSEVIEADGSGRDTALVLVDEGSGGGLDSTIAVRMAARFGELRIYRWDPQARLSDSKIAVTGRLYAFPLTLDAADDGAHDRWERAAMLIHERYAAQVTKKGPATRPWAELAEFYRESNRRQVTNALWMVEEIAGHTWTSFGSVEDSPPPGDAADPLTILVVMGFDETAALAMAKKEHEDWCRYYWKEGWRYADTSELEGMSDEERFERKLHGKLVGWEKVVENAELKCTALTSLATTLTQLRQLGYVSTPRGER